MVKVNLGHLVGLSSSFIWLITFVWSETDRCRFSSMIYTVSFSSLTNLNSLISDFSSLDPYIFVPIKPEFLPSKPEAEHVTECIMRAVSSVADLCIHENVISYTERKYMIMLIIKYIYIQIEIQNTHVFTQT